MNSKYRLLFTIDENITYLNHAAVGVLPRAAKQMMNQLINRLSKTGEPPIEEIIEKLNTFRENVGKLISVEPTEVAFVHNTTEGLSIALNSIPWEEGDNIIVQADAFPACLYILHYCFPQIKKKFVPLNRGKDFIDRISQQIDFQTRAIIVDHVHFLSGIQLNLNEIGELAKQHGLYLIVDGIQAVGAVDINLRYKNVHFYTAGGMKWLLGPMGTGFLYVDQNILNELNVHHVGWLSADYEDLSSLYPVKPLVNSARRFERANFNLIGLYGLVESLKMINEISSEKIEQNILSKTRQFMTKLEAKDCKILTPFEDTIRSGIVSFRLKNVDPKQTYEKLERANIICSFREGWIRIATHFFNTEEELSRILKLI